MARARKSGQTKGEANESAILEELRELSESAHEAVDTAREFDDANDRLTKAAEVVGKAWSKGFVGC
jgi:hypothetical protein